jgi:hypothetical protein
MVSSLIFSQSRYPLQTVIDGDSVVILTKAQADTINAIFESQKSKIANFKQQTKVKDSIIAMRDTLLVFYTERYIEYRTIVEQEIIRDETLDSITEWLLLRAKENSWIYYSYKNNEVVAVDLSTHVVRKDDYKGDIMFFKITKDCPVTDDEKEPKIGWQFDIALPSRPKLNVLKLK